MVDSSRWAMRQATWNRLLAKAWPGRSKMESRRGEDGRGLVIRTIGELFANGRESAHSPKFDNVQVKDLGEIWQDRYSTLMRQRKWICRSLTKVVRVGLVVKMPSGCIRVAPWGARWVVKPAKSPQGWGFVVLCDCRREVTI